MATLLPPERHAPRNLAAIAAAFLLLVGSAAATGALDPASAATGSGTVLPLPIPTLTPLDPAEPLAEAPVVMPEGLTEISDPHAGHGVHLSAPAASAGTGDGLPVRQAGDAGGAGNASTPASGVPVVKVQLEIVAKTVNVLGVPTEVWTYGGTVPGKIIRVSEGTQLEVTIVNGHSQTHSLHTHFRGNLLGSDGSSDTAPLPVVPHQHNPYPVTQNPIGPYEPREDRDVADPGASYTYTFFADTPGNFLYHCHVFLATDHIERGLFGMFVVYPKGWSWEEMPADEVNGNTKARVTDDQGRSYYEDVIFMSELSPAALPATPVAAPVGAPITTEYPTSVTTSGFTPAATGKIHMANYRAWNDPYVVGPVRPNEKVIMRVANIGDEMHSWHVHSHWFDIVDKTSHDWKPMRTDDVLLMGPGDTALTMLTAGNPGYWFMHDHIVPEAYTGMVPWLLVEGEPVANVAPDLWVDNLVDGQVVAGVVPILGRADDFEGREMVKSVEVQINGGAWTPVDGLLSWRHVWDTRGLADGTHTVQVRSFDGRGYSAESVMNVEVRNQAPAAQPAAATQAESHDDSNLPGVGLLAVLAVLGAAALAWRRK